jgi:hypothetical protein
MGSAAGLLPVEIIMPDSAPLVIAQATAWLEPYPHPLLQGGKRADHVPSLALHVVRVWSIIDKPITAFELHARAGSHFRMR